MKEVPGVAGVKQSAGDMKLFADLQRRAEPQNQIYAAVDALLYLAYVLGAPGSIAAILTAAPGPSVRLWDAVKIGDHATALDLHERLMPLWGAIGQDNMPSLCKYAQELQGVPAGCCAAAHFSRARASKDGGQGRLGRAGSHRPHDGR